MPDNVKPVETLPVASPSDALGGLAKALRTLREPTIWLRVGMLLLGTVLLFMAILQLTGDNKLSDKTKTIVKVVAAVAK